MFKRDILTALKQWMNDSHRKPLVLRGARQVGKTTLIHQFGEEFDNYLYLNLEKKKLEIFLNYPFHSKIYCL